MMPQTSPTVNQTGNGEVEIGAGDATSAWIIHINTQFQPVNMALWCERVVSPHSRFTDIQLSGDVPLGHRCIELPLPHL